MTKTVTRLSAIILALVLAAATLGLYATAASAGGPQRGGGGGGDRTEINTSNAASVSNGVMVVANTGGNSADGGNGGRGGDGGNGSGAGMISIISSNDGGNGGSGGRGGDAGTVTTGPAEAWGTVDNFVNNNNIMVEGCGCDSDNNRHGYHGSNDSESLQINTRNRAQVENGLMVLSNTGGNSADGGNGGRGGEGGSGSGAWFSWFSLYSDNDGGNGAGGRDGGTAGAVRTGSSYSNGYVTNVVNQNVIRVKNGQNPS